MYNLTTAERATWMHPYPQTTTITGDGISITEADIISGGMTVDRRTASGSTLEVGAVIAAELAINLENSDGRWNSTVFEGKDLYVQVTSNSVTVPMGYFTVDEAPRKLKQISLVAYDRMMQFDRAYNGDITFPSTPAMIVNRCCSICDVPLAIDDWTGYTNNSVSVTAPDEISTYRQLLAWAFQIMGVNGWINHTGQLTCGWYEEPTTELEITSANRFSSDLGDDDITITGVEIDGTLYGTDTYVMSISGNSLITDDNRAEIGAALRTKLSGFSYYNATATVMPIPFVWPGDILTYVKGSTDYPICVTGITYVLNGHTTLESVGETATANGYATANPLTSAESAIVKQIAEQTATEMSDRAVEISHLNDIANNALGFYSTLVQESDGSYTEYTHDKSTLATSTIIYKKNSAGFFLSQDGGATYTSGWDSSGNAVLNILAVNGISAQWIKTGLLTDQATGGDNFYLDLNTGKLVIGSGDLTYENGTMMFGKESASVRMSLDNDSLDIIETATSEVVASFSGDTTTMNKAQVGNWLTSADNGFTLKWVGGDV